MSVSLFHRDLGGAGHPPLILLHGLLGSSRNWQTAGADLSGRYHVFALDLRNHGRSPHAGDMDYESQVDDVLAWADLHDLRRFSLLGHSLGGKVAMRLACHFKSNVEQLFVVDIAPKNYSSGGHDAEFSAMNALDLEKLNSRADAETLLESSISDWGMRKFLATNLERNDEGKWQWIINLRGLTDELPKIEMDSLDARDMFEGPTRFILGGKSPYFKPIDRAGVTARFPKAEFVSIADAGHNPHIEARAEFVRAVLAQ